MGEGRLQWAEGQNLLTHSKINHIFAYQTETSFIEELTEKEILAFIVSFKLSDLNYLLVDFNDFISY